MKKMYTRRDVLAAGAAATAVAAFPATGSAQNLERKKVTIAVGGKNLLYYLPLTIAEQMKFFDRKASTSTSSTSPAAHARCRPWWAAAPTSCPAPSSTTSTCRRRASR